MGGSQEINYNTLLVDVHTYTYNTLLDVVVWFNNVFLRTAE